MRKKNYPFAWANRARLCFECLMLTWFTRLENLYPYSLCRAACFANFQGILGFSVSSIILADLLGNVCLLVIGAFRSTLFASVFQGSLLVIALFRAMID